MYIFDEYVWAYVFPGEQSSQLIDVSITSRNFLCPFGFSVCVCVSVCVTNSTQ